MRHIWHAFRGNSRVATLTGLLWVVSLVPLAPYDQLFRIQLGMTESEVGYLRSLDFMLRCLMIWMSGYVSDRFGPTRVLFYGDILSWVIPAAIMATASTPAHAVIATMLFATNGICFAAFQQVLIGGAPSTGRRYVLAAHTAFNLIPGILMPSVGGWLVARTGIVPAMHVLYGSLCLFTALGILIRLKTFRMKPRTMVTANIPAHRILRRPGILPLFLAGVSLGSAEAIMGTYASVYIVGRMGLATAWLSAFQSMSAVVVLIMNLLVFPRLSRRVERKLIIARGAIAGTAGLALLTGSTSLLPIWIACGAIGVAIKQTSHHARWVNTLPPEDRSRLLGTAAAAGQIVAAAMMIPAAMLYGHGLPRTVLGMAVIFELISALLTARSFRAAPIK